MKPIILFFLTVIGVEGLAQEYVTKMNRKYYYDFSITVKIYGGLERYEDYYFINLDTSRNILQFESYMHFDNDSNSKEIIIKNLKYQQLDSIYEMTRNTFNINAKPKKFKKNEINFIPPYDGAYATIEFDSGGGLYYYNAKIANEEVEKSSSQEFSKLIRYIKRIVKSP